LNVENDVLASYAYQRYHVDTEPTVSAVLEKWPVLSFTKFVLLSCKCFTSVDIEEQLLRSTIGSHCDTIYAFMSGTRSPLTASMSALGVMSTLACPPAHSVASVPALGGLSTLAGPPVHRTLDWALRVTSTLAGPPANSVASVSAVEVMSTLVSLPVHSIASMSSLGVMLIRMTWATNAVNWQTMLT